MVAEHNLYCPFNTIVNAWLRFPYIPQGKCGVWITRGCHGSSVLARDVTCVPAPTWGPALCATSRMFEDTPRILGQAQKDEAVCERRSYPRRGDLSGDRPRRVAGFGVGFERIFATTSIKLRFQLAQNCNALGFIVESIEM